MMVRLFIAIVLFFGISVAASAQRREIRLETPFHEETELRKSVEMFAERANSRLAGEYHISIYTNEELVGIPNGSSDLYFIPVEYLYSNVESAKIFSLPFLFADYKQLNIFQMTSGRKIMSDVSEIGYVGIAFFNGYMNAIVGKNYRGYADFVGQKIALTSADRSTSVEALGAAAVVTKQASVPDSLFAGGVDAASVNLREFDLPSYASPSASHSYIVSRPHTPNVALLISKVDSWQNFPARVVSILKEEAESQISFDNIILQNSHFRITSTYINNGYSVDESLSKNVSELEHLWRAAWDKNENSSVVDAGINLSNSYLSAENFHNDARESQKLFGSSNDEILFATDRRDENSREPRYAFAHVRGRDTSYGSVEFRAPENRSFGQRLVIKSVNRKSPHDLLLYIKLKLSQMKTDQVDIYVHGFNNLFYQAAESYATLHKDLSLKGLPIIFSWPSDGYSLRYSSDSEEVFNSVNNFVSFVKYLSENINNVRINIIAHSMGSRLIFESLENIASRGDDFSHIKNIVLAAPDITVFRFEQMSFLSKSDDSTVITIYASEYDKALTCSKFVNDSLRLGQGGELISVYAGIHSIDASGVEKPNGMWDTLMANIGFCETGHSYISENRLVVNDMATLINFDAMPDMRAGLRRDHKSGVPYWRMVGSQ